ncbi:MAG: hypothetical protein F6J94_01745 [Moorea sp. SIO1F2]|uniref:hypothetical protein n=1 Tax=Moorena sp. SIO1F2 TaxID=2607819 RepID=UPI0013B767F5|nr:hypothetical protein [Moorena sp. SIO1F2]NET80743.1 hypothetical protein [Moorena sp. SIO1F2]
MILIVLWNGHQAWNWHLASFMLIFGRAGCPFYSYSLLDSATPIFFLFPCSLFPTPCSLLPTPFSDQSYVHLSNTNAIE